MSVPYAKTSLGAVSGRACIKPKKKDAKQVYRYSGIPFAKPPVGELRFEPPQKLTERWDGVLDGTQVKSVPYQQIEIMKGMDPYFVYTNEFDENFEQTDEDCLYLKVYTSNPNPHANMPVMFWIYGGGFQMGGTSPYSGSVLASLHDVVVVMANYRVNIFGLMSFKPGETTCNGNMGMLDQVCALEWVRDNIKGFGGDPNNVTIFGESAGAGSVSLHVLSDMSRGLFHRAISHSGVAGNNMVLDCHNDAAREKVLELLNIEEKDPKKILQKLKEVPAKDLLKANGDIMMTLNYFSIAIDGEFLKDWPEDLIAKKKFNQVPYMLGCNSTEGCGLMAPGQDKGFATGISCKDGKESLKGLLSYAYQTAKNEKVFNAIWNKYEEIHSDANDPLRYSRIIGDIAADIIFNTASITVAKGHSSTETPTYFYRMNHKTRFSHEKEFQPAEGAVFKSDLCECDHGDDIPYTFGLPHTSAKLTLSTKFSDEEKSLSDQWMGYLTNFATTGNPNEGGYKPAVEWEKFAKDGKHLQVNSNPTMQGDFYGIKYKFWTEDIKKVEKQVMIEDSK